jgi:hypothetical protein
MSRPFKVGDLVTCVNVGNNSYITQHKKYTINRVCGDDGTIRITDDQGDEGHYSVTRFQLVDADLVSLITLAYTFVGKKFTLSSSPRVKRDCDRVKVYLHRDEFNGGTVGSVNAHAMFDTLGFAVMIGTSGYECDVRHAIEAPNSKKIDLTNDYDAEVFADKVVVGCQTITKDKVVELLKTMEDLSD